MPHDLTMTPLAIEHALLAVMAARDGDAAAATDHLARAQHQSRTAARRARQLVEIAALIVEGNRPRAAGLALEHASQFVDDAELLAIVTAIDGQA
jgi:hypothetical protein